MLKTLFLQTIFIFSITAITTSNSNQLLSAVVIHRHGDRNPFTTYKTDPYRDESHWPEGFGQLTKRGIQRQYELGQWLHTRYKKFLPPRYTPKTIRVFSTDVDRTLMSAEVTLAGLFPPPENIIPNLNWQPIPIHTKPPHEDALLAMKKPCKKFQQMFDDLLTSEHIEEINDINKNLYEFLANKTGEEIKDVFDVEKIYNALETQFLANKTLPNWAFEIYPEKMKPAVGLRFKMPCYHKDMTRLRIGLLFGEIIQNFISFVNGQSGLAKFLVYSGHDSTLAEILVTLGAFNNEVPPYSSAILMELYQNGEGGHYVNIFFKNSTILYEIILETCTFDCKFEDFVKILAPILQPNQENWERECQN